jgi:phage FluMu gp28-like protein
MLLVQCLDLPTASGIEDAVWEKFQIDELNNDSMFGLTKKCRQVGWSFVIAARGVADAILDGRSSVYNSINQKESQDKIRYAKSIYENLHTPFPKPKIVIDNRSELEFDNGARLVSTASARGLPNSNFFLDEAAWKPNAREIYVASVPIITKGGSFRMGSSTNGAGGLFWEIDTESFKSYPGFVRQQTFWWEVEAFCSDIKKAVKEAPYMTTEARVEKFATPRLRTIFENSIVEDFQQEYEAIYVDETTAWITWDEIRANQTLADGGCVIASSRGSVDEVLAAIDRLKALLQQGNIESVLSAGVDIGRTRNTSEVFVVGETTTGQFPLRAMLTMDNVSFDGQQAVLKRVLEIPNISKMLIDRNGIGMNLAENMETAFPSKAEGAQFTNEAKRLWATGLKMHFQQQRVPIPVDRDLGYQIHSIKRLVTPSKNLVFDTERNEKHHADKFWALGLAVAAAAQPVFSVTDRERSAFAGLSL